MKKHTPSLFLALSILLTSTTAFAQETRTHIDPIQIKQTVPETEASQDFPESTLRKSKNGEPVTTAARAELVLAQTLYGLGFGIEVGITAHNLFGIDGTTPIIASYAGGLALGLGGSLLLSRDGITAGQATTYNSGVAWGLGNGFAVSQILDLEGNEIFTGLLAGHLVGLGGAALVWNLFEPTAGTVALANTSQIWTTAITTLIHGTTGFAASKPLLWGSLLAASNVGLVTGALLSQTFPMSRQRAFVIDGGTALGGLTGAALYALVQRGKNQPLEGYMATTLAGTVLGLTTTAYFSRNWDLNTDTSAQLFINPTHDGATIGLAGNF